MALYSPPKKSQRYFLSIRRPEAIYDLCRIISSFFPDPDEVFTGIYELILNAIEHGNLAIGYGDKSNLIRKGEWLDEVNRRLEMPEYKERMVHITVVEDKDGIEMTIVDDGSGFDWQAQLNYNLNDNKPHGRGLWIAQQSGFSSLEFNAKGNAITCGTKRLENN